MKIFSNRSATRSTRFPTDTTASDVAPEIIERLGWLYGPILAVFYLISILAILYYRIERKTHAANLAMLKRSQPESTIP